MINTAASETSNHLPAHYYILLIQFVTNNLDLANHMRIMKAKSPLTISIGKVEIAFMVWVLWFSK